jgi:hypothetical protein
LPIALTHTSIITIAFPECRTGSGDDSWPDEALSSFSEAMDKSVNLPVPFGQLLPISTHNAGWCLDSGVIIFYTPYQWGRDINSNNNQNNRTKGKAYGTCD